MNRLDAVLLLTTTKEIKSGKFFKFCDQFLTMKKNNLSLHIFINNPNYDQLELLTYIAKITIFKAVFLTELNIPPELDIYIRNEEYTGKIPSLGLVSGPNIMFLEAIKSCFNKFNTVLLLESDCFLKQNCFEVSKAYIDSSSDFLISGSRYVGNAMSGNLDLTLNLHLNGVGFYATGCKEFQDLVAKMESYILKRVTKNPNLPIAYDMAFTSCLMENYNTDSRRTLSKLINTTFILNCSLPADASISYEYINTLYPKHIIFHTKMNYWDVFR